MSTLLAIDPAITNAGLALFKNKKLVACTVISRDSSARNDEAWAYMARHSKEWLDVELGRKADGIAYEMMQVYEAYGNDLLQVVGALAWTLALTAKDDADLTAYLPSQWKGNKKKHVVEHRSRKRLSRKELFHVRKGLKDVNKSVRHNAWDAVGIGLVHLRRMRR